MRTEIAIIVAATWLAGVAAAPDLPAQALHKCVAADGPPSYQSAPCPPDRRTAWVRDATPEPTPDARRRATLRQEQARRDVGSRYLAGLARRRGGGTSRTIATARDATSCATARIRREQRLVRAGLDRDFDLLRRLDDAVARACR